jgi:Ca-activated chloride channel family protein
VRKISRHGVYGAILAAFAAFGLLGNQDFGGSESATIKGAQSAQSASAQTQSDKEKDKDKDKKPEGLKPTESRTMGTVPPTDARPNIEPRVRPKPGSGPDPEDPGERRSNIRVDSTLVLIPVSVMDPMNRSVTGLEKEHFRVFEDKVEQDVLQFSSEDSPITVGVVFDASGSMGAKLQKSRQAVAQFFKTANPEDEFFLIQFNDRPQLVVPLTSSTEEIQNQLTFTNAKGRTALLDGVYMAMKTMRKARNPRKAILILSDGGDNSSRYTESEVRNAVREADVQVYAIGIFEPMSGRGRSPEELSGPGLLQELAEQTGGRHFPVENLNELPDVAAKIGIELRNHYVLGYTPKNQERDGKYRRVKVSLKQPPGLPPLRPFFRLGYYAPAQ